MLILILVKYKKKKIQKKKNTILQKFDLLNIIIIFCFQRLCFFILRLKKKKQ